MSVKTWDLLDRETGRAFWSGSLPEGVEEWRVANPDAPVAYCRETGEVVYR